MSFEKQREPGQWPSEEEMRQLNKKLAEIRAELRLRTFLGSSFFSQRDFHSDLQRWFTPTEQIELKWQLWEALKPLSGLSEKEKFFIVEKFFSEPSSKRSLLLQILIAILLDFIKEVNKENYK